MVAPKTPEVMRVLKGQNVALASRIYLPEPGAASFRLAALARALRDSGAITTVLTSTSPEAYREPVADHQGVTVKRRRVLRDSQGYVRGYVQYMSFDIPLFFRLLFMRRLDLVVVEPPPTTGVVVALVCAIRRIPYVYYAADLWADAVASTDAPPLIARFVRWLERISMRRASAVLSVSRQVSERIDELAMGVTPTTIGNGVDTTLFSPAGPAHPSTPPYLLYAGTASEVHGAGIFMDAFARVCESNPDARLVFVGQGAERQQLEEKARSLPAGSVAFAARLSPEETASWIRGARATLASVRPGAYTIGFPTKIYASIACGTPVVYAGEGVATEFAAKYQIGWSVDYSVDDVVSAMTEALSVPVAAIERDRLARLARDEVSLMAVAGRAVSVIAAVAAPQTQRNGS